MDHNSGHLEVVASVEEEEITLIIIIAKIVVVNVEDNNKLGKDTIVVNLLMDIIIMDIMAIKIKDLNKDIVAIVAVMDLDIDNLMESNLEKEAVKVHVAINNMKTTENETRGVTEKSLKIF